MDAAITTRFRSLWVAAGIAALLAGVAAFVVESQIATGRPCPVHNGGGVAYDIVFLALALAPGAGTALVGWRSGRSAADTVGPFCVAMCLAILLVFIGLSAAWGGHGCMT